MQVALTIPIIHIGNLLTPEGEVSNNFLPITSGGFLPGDVSARIYPLALQMRGYTAAVSRLILDQLIIVNSLVGIWDEENRVDH